jgi:hypothetical protein
MEGKKLGELVILVALMLIIISIFFSGDGLMGDVKDSVFETIDWVKQFLPTFGIGMDQLSSDTSVTAEHRDQILSLNQTIWKMLDSTNTGCFENFGDFSELGEGGATLTFTQTSSSVDLMVSGGAGGKQFDTSLSISFPGMQLCVIAGPNGIADNFYDHYVDSKEIKVPYYYPVTGINIYYTKDEGKNGNVIRVFDSGGEPVIKDQGNNFESEGWLFKPTEGHICFFPTNDHVNANDNGMADEWFTSKEEDSIPKKAALNNLCN